MQANAKDYILLYLNELICWFAMFEQIVGFCWKVTLESRILLEKMRYVGKLHSHT